jgi:opacity protein-like surface antigen
MNHLKTVALGATMLAGMSFHAIAADPYYGAADPVATPPVVYEQESSSYGGWYLRGDVDHHWSDFRGGDYITYEAPFSDEFDFGDLDSAWSLGAGIGYQINKYFRTDLTGDYWFKSDFTGQTSDGIEVSVDRTRMSAFLLLANAYVDIGTWHGITPYVGAGVGGAWVKWDELNNDIIDGGEFDHRGGRGWRFAYALSAGASYCLTEKLKFDAGYRFSHINGGKMFDYTDGAAGPGFDDGFDTHEVRGGLRYQFGKNECSEPEPIAYVPEPVYTK